MGGRGVNSVRDFRDPERHRPERPRLHRQRRANADRQVRRSPVNRPGRRSSVASRSGPRSRARAMPDGTPIDEVLMGQVLQAGAGQAPARQAALRGGLAETTSATTINRVCGSGLKAIMLAAAEIRAGDAEVAVAGGMESMNLAPYLVPGARFGLRLGDSTLVDATVHDGLWCSVEDCHMGTHAERVAISDARDPGGPGRLRPRKPPPGGGGHRRRALRRRDGPGDGSRCQGAGDDRGHRRGTPSGLDGRGPCPTQAGLRPARGARIVVTPMPAPSPPAMPRASRTGPRRRWSSASGRSNASG